MDLLLTQKTQNANRVQSNELLQDAVSFLIFQWNKGRINALLQGTIGSKKRKKFQQGYGSRTGNMIS